MTATATYTVFRSDDWSVTEGQRLTLKEAAEALLETDGYAFEIRQEDGLFELFVSDGSCNSPRGSRHMKSCAAGGYISHDINDLYRKIVANEWRGYEAMTDEDFEAAQVSEDEDEE